MRLLQALFVGSVCALVWLAWTSREPPTGLRRIAADAKEAGRRSIAFTNLVEVMDGDLGELLQTFSLVSARTSRVSAIQTRDDDFILTWDVFREVQILSKIDPPPDGCRLKKPRRLRLQQGEVAMPRDGGTVTIAGVQITIRSNAGTPVDPGQRYTFLANVCPQQVMTLPLLGFEVFTVFEDGRIAPVRRHVNLEFQQQMEALGTVEVLDRFASLMTARDVR